MISNNCNIINYLNLLIMDNQFIFSLLLYFFYYFFQERTFNNVIKEKICQKYSLILNKFILKKIITSNLIKKAQLIKY